MNSHTRSRNSARQAVDSIFSKQPQRVQAQETSLNVANLMDSYWVRSALRQLGFLRSTLSVDPEAARIVDCAIRWAPFGGADCGDLLVMFGFGRQRFIEKLDDALRPSRVDGHEAAWLKHTLSDALMSTWQA